MPGEAQGSPPNLHIASGYSTELRLPCTQSVDFPASGGGERRRSDVPLLPAEKGRSSALPGTVDVWWVGSEVRSLVSGRLVKEHALGLRA
jgi:hypothetical protein